MTFGTRADWLYVLCRTDPDAPKHRGLSLILVPATRPGVDIRPIRNLADGEEFAEVFFTDARTAPTSSSVRSTAAWYVVDGNRRAPNAARPCSRTRRRSSSSWHDLVVELQRATAEPRDPVVRQRLAQAWIGLQLNRYNNARMLTRLLRDGTLGPEASLSKLFWSQLAPRPRRVDDGPARRRRDRRRRRLTRSIRSRASSSTPGPRRSTAAPTRSSATSSPSACSASRRNRGRERRARERVSASALRSRRSSRGRQPLRDFVEQVEAAGLDHLCVGDHVSFRDGYGLRRARRRPPRSPSSRRCPCTRRCTCSRCATP